VSVSTTLAFYLRKEEDMTIIEYYRTNGITQEQLDALAGLMDEDLREQVHEELAPCEPMQFLERYCELDEDFAASEAW